MLTTSYTTVDRVIENVYRDFGFVNINKSEVMEWIWDVMGVLNIYSALESKFRHLPIVEWKTIIPVDMYKIENIREKTTGVLLRKTTDLFHRLNSSNDSGIGTTTVFEGPTIVIDANGSVDINNTTVFVAQWGNGPVIPEQLTYQEHNGSIYFGFKDGDVEISYSAFPVTDDGEPKIPDDPQYIRAVVTYIAARLATRGYYRGEMSKAIKDDIDSQYCFAAGAAKGKAIIPDIDMMEAIKNMRMRLIPKPNEHATGFKYSGEIERLRKI